MNLRDLQRQSQPIARFSHKSAGLLAVPPDPAFLTVSQLFHLPFLYAIE